MKFIDGFGERRVFCKGCGRSFLEEGMSFRNMNQFKLDTYIKLPMPR